MNWSPLARHHFSAQIKSKYGHDPFGSFRTENDKVLTGSLDRWIDNSGYITYRYGADSAKINLESVIGIDNRRYQTNRDLTRYLDYRTWSARETAYYNVSSRTSLLAEVEHLNSIYYASVPGFPTRDGQETGFGSVCTGWPRDTPAAISVSGNTGATMTTVSCRVYVPSTGRQL